MVFTLYCFRAEQEAMGLLGQGKKRKALTNSPKLLTEMLKKCFDKFKNVVSAHSVLLVHLHRAKRVYNKSKSSLCVWAGSCVLS